MRTFCCVLNCPSGSSTPSHKFPKNPSLFEAWKAAVYSCKVEDLNDDELKRSVVCYRHFKECNYVQHAQRRLLKRDAIPSLYLPNIEMNIEDATSELIQSASSQPSLRGLQPAQSSRVPNVNANVEDATSELIHSASPQPSSSASKPSQSSRVPNVNANVEDATSELIQSALPQPSLRGLQPAQSSHVPNVNANVEDCTSELIHSASPQPSSSASQPAQCSRVPNVNANVEDATSELIQSASPQPCSSGLAQLAKKRKLSRLPPGVKSSKLTPIPADVYRFSKLLCGQQTTVQKKRGSISWMRARDAVRYFNSWSVQSLLAHLTPTQRTFMHMKVRTAKNKPKMCTKWLYHFSRERALSMCRPCRPLNGGESTLSAQNSYK